MTIILISCINIIILSKEVIGIGSTEKFDMVVIFKQVETDHDKDELDGIEEIKLALEDSTPELYIKESECLDVVLVELGTDGVEAAKKLRKCPTQIISRIVPVQAVVSTDLKSILYKVKELAIEKMQTGSSYIINSELRDMLNLDHKLMTESIVDMLYTINIYKDEKKPDYIIYIECIGNDTGLGIHKTNDKSTE